MINIIPKLVSLPFGIASSWIARGVLFLIYHKVEGRFNLELDLPFSLFCRQLQYLAQTGRVVSFEHALALLERQQPLSENLFVLTFDDGYRDFYTHVYPLLRELQLPAILYVNTGFVESGITYPLGKLNLSDAPVTWDMLGEMQESGLVTLGAHTHTHVWLTEATDTLMEELIYPVELFQHHLNLRPVHFAYPGGLWNKEVEGVISRYYVSAVIGGGRMATASNYLPYRIPRVPVRRSDGWLFFRARIQGWIQHEERFYELFQRSSLYRFYLKFLSHSNRKS